MKIVLIGQKWLAAEVFQALASAGMPPVLIIAPVADDRAAQVAGQAGVHVSVADKVVDTCHIPPGTDLIVCAHAHAYITQAARERAKHGAIGYHPSLLPRHRGRDAVEWTIRMRDPIAGGTVYRLEDGADTGPIVLQDWAHVHQQDTASTLWRRALGPMGVRLLVESVRLFASGNVTAIDQDETYATWEPALSSGKKLSN